MSLNYEELKRRNDTNINKLQNAPSITIIDQELWQTLIDLNKDQTTLLEDTADIQTVKTCTENSKKAVKILGGSVEDIISFEIPDTDMARTILKIHKTKATPKRFPRKAGLPTKEPIC